MKFSFDQIYQADKDVALDVLTRYAPRAELRLMIFSHCDLLPMLTPDHIERSSLTKKQWVLVLGSIKWQTYNRKVKLSKETHEFLYESLTYELVSGESKSSKPLSWALKRFEGIETHDRTLPTT